MIIFSRNSLKYQNIQSPPEHTANGNVYMDILLLGIIALEYVIQNNFWWVLVYFLKIENFFGRIHQYYLVALTLCLLCTEFHEYQIIFKDT